MKLLSKTSLLVVTLALADPPFRPQAGPVTPDPADCFFIHISAQISTGGKPQNIYMVALSGDGKTALLRSRYAAYEEPIIKIDEEFVFANKTRTLLTHFDSAQHVNGPVYHISGPSWTSVDLPFDGSFVATTQSASQAQLLSVPDGSVSALPLSSALKVSGNGAWIIGRDSEDQLVRFRRADHHIDVLDEIPEATGASVFGVSYNGDTVYGRNLKIGPSVVFRWTATQGFSEPHLPENFTPSSMDASGEILAGQLSLATQFVPAYWSEGGGLVPLTTKLNGVDAGGGQATLISGNGQLIFGSLGPPTGPGVPVVWTRDGSVYELASLIRGVDFGGEAISTVDAVSHDGRTIGGISYVQATLTDSFYLAGLALPGEGPRISLQPVAAGGHTLNFHAKTSFHYQVQSSTSLGGWSAAAVPEITGDDADHAVPLPAGSEGTTFFRVVVNP